MNNSKLVKIIIAVVILGGLGLFVKNYVQFGSPEKTIPSSKDPSSSISQQAGLKVGDTFPDFNVTEVDGKTISNDSLKGKPTIIWFTTSWCVPCQIGALDVSKLDDELSGNTFDVLVVFVDLKETPGDLQLWRKRFAREDWMVAFDNELTKLAARVNLRFLDSKFLLDKNGVIKNIDFKQADENYLNTIRQTVKEN